MSQLNEQQIAGIRNLLDTRKAFVNAELKMQEAIEAFDRSESANAAVVSHYRTTVRYEGVVAYEGRPVQISIDGDKVIVKELPVVELEIPF